MTSPLSNRTQWNNSQLSISIGKLKINFQHVNKSVFLFVITCLLGSTLQAQTTNHKVYSLFVINVAKFASFPEIGSDFKIVVLGKSKVFEELQKVAASKDVNGKKLIVTQEDDLTNITDVQIIYLSDGKTGSLSEVTKKFEGKPVMIISEREGLFKRGAALSFVVSDDGKLRIDINKTELEKRQIKISQAVLSSLSSTVI